MHAAFVACLSLVPVVHGFQGLTGDLPGSLTANSTCSLADFYTKCGNDIASAAGYAGNPASLSTFCEGNCAKWLQANQVACEADKLMQIPAAAVLKAVGECATVNNALAGSLSLTAKCGVYQISHVCQGDTMTGFSKMETTYAQQENALQLLQQGFNATTGQKETFNDTATMCPGWSAWNSTCRYIAGKGRTGENKTACYQDTRTLCDQFTSLRSCKSSINAAGFLTALCAGADPLGTTGWGCSSNCARVLVQCAPTIMQGNNDGESNTYPEAVRAMVEQVDNACGQDASD